MSVTVPGANLPNVVRQTIEEAITLSNRLERPAFVTHVEPFLETPDPLAFLAASSDALGSGVLWSQQSSGLTFAGAGAALDFIADGPGRFGDASAAIRDLRKTLVGNAANQPFPLLGGFSFDDQSAPSERWREFPGCRFILPRTMLQIGNGRALLRITLSVSPHESACRVSRHMEDLLEVSREWANTPLPQWPDHELTSNYAVPDRETWESSIATAVADIRQGRFDKVVLAREERLLANGPFSPFTALSRLGALDPAGTLFAIQSGASWFIGASPERLVRLADGRVDVSCLAGSIGIGESPTERQALAEQLLASKKNREEHEIVVRSTMSALEADCEDVRRSRDSPRVVVARSVQHLETPITARLRSDSHVLDLVERLHPTPAVGGHPREEALTAIRELEAIDRGWYAGPFGWADLEGSGEFSVAIRSALLGGRSASVFAGGGIVADSDPADEFAETCLKLRPMVSALGGS